MSKIIFLIVAILSYTIIIAQPPQGPSKKGMNYGEKISSVGAINVSDIEQKVNNSKETEIKVKGKVAEVCTQMGCWLKMETANGKVMVKMKDHGFFVPVDLSGKEIIVTGTAKITETSVSELIHYAEDANKSKKEIEAIKEPKKEIIISAKGVLVL